MRDEHPHCEQCDEELFHLDGEFYCPACDSLSGFELTPEQDQFQL